MKKLRAFFIWCALLATPLSSSAAVIFSEIAWMGTATSQFSEWIELYNTDSTPVDLAGGGIYKTGGTTLVFSLTKTIPANGYLLVERVTASAPDAVPGINDESGSFAASGLSNSGEHLVLKDKNGVVLDSVNATGGWPAGDNTTKQTMQLSGTTWVTATSTPKAPVSITPPPAATQTQQATSSASFSEEVAALSSHSSTVQAGQTTIGADFTASIGRERLTVVGSRIEFEARTAGTYSGTLGYVWSFGDGSQSTQKNPTHIYSYPGDYVVVLRVGTEETYAIARTLVHVVPVELSLAIHESGRVDVSNDSPYEVNIGEWKIDTGKSLFVFPKDTIVLGKKRISLSRETTGMTVYSSSTPYLRSPDSVVSLAGVGVAGIFEQSGSTPQVLRTDLELEELRGRISALLAILESTRSALEALSRK